LGNTSKDHKFLQYVHNNPKVQKLGSVWSLHNNNVSSGLAVIMRIAEQLSEGTSIKIGIKYGESWLQLSPSLDIIIHSIYRLFNWNGILRFIGYIPGSCTLVFETELLLLWEMKLAKLKGSLQLGPFDVLDITLVDTLLVIQETLPEPPLNIKTELLEFIEEKTDQIVINDRSEKGLDNIQRKNNQQLTGNFNFWVYNTIADERVKRWTESLKSNSFLQNLSLHGKFNYQNMKWKYSYY
jgi:hypothetical protein